MRACESIVVCSLRFSLSSAEHTSGSMAKDTVKCCNMLRPHESSMIYSRKNFYTWIQILVTHNVTIIIWP